MRLKLGFLAAIAMLFAALAAPATTLAAYGSNGNCTDSSPNGVKHYLMGEAVTRASNGVGPWGLEADISHSPYFEECTNKGPLDTVASKTFLSLLDGTGGHGQIAVGVIECKTGNPFGPGYCQGTGSPRFFVNVVECNWPNNDQHYDLGPWSSGSTKTVKIEWGTYYNKWYVYLDGLFIRSFGGEAVHCLNPEQGDLFEGAFFAERQDAGDGLGTQSVPTIVREMSQAKDGPGQWVASGVSGSGCDFNPGTTYYEGHAQHCDVEFFGRDKLLFWTYY